MYMTLDRRCVLETRGSWCSLPSSVFIIQNFDQVPVHGNNEPLLLLPKKKKSGRFSVTDYILLVAHDGRGSLVKRGRGGERERGVLTRMEYVEELKQDLHWNGLGKISMFLSYQENDVNDEEESPRQKR